MYQRLMEVMRNQNNFEDILKIILASITEGPGLRPGRDFPRQLGPEGD